MTQSDIDAYFEIMGESFSRPAKVILIGGAAALLMGGQRVTRDVDFEIDSKETPETLSASTARAGNVTGLGSEFTSDIERWSMLNLMDYRKQTRLYKKFGKISVHVLKPEYWSIGKIGRYLDSDVTDMIAVFKAQKTPLKDVLRVWNKTLHSSPVSDELFHFKKHVEDFFKEYGKKVWGTAFNAPLAIKRIFLKPAREIRNSA